MKVSVTYRLPGGSEQTEEVRNIHTVHHGDYEPLTAASGQVPTDAELIAWGLSLETPGPAAPDEVFRYLSPGDDNGTTVTWNAQWVTALRKGNNRLILLVHDAVTWSHQEDDGSTPDPATIPDH